MKCPECEKENLESIIYKKGNSSTLVNYMPFYDKEGNYHNHDKNIATSDYKCSNGHRFIIKSSGSCWCGWKNEI